MLLNEALVNPPGPDAPNEFVEIKGSPGAAITNVYLLALEGEPGNNAGRVAYAAHFSGLSLGSNGLLVLAATNSPFAIPPGALLVTEPEFSVSGGALPNRTLSLLLVRTAGQIRQGDDLDKGDNGILEGLPADTVILDAVGWQAGNASDIVYGGVNLGTNPPDALGRFPGNLAAVSVGAWYFGQLAGTNAASFVFNALDVSPNFPGGAGLSPGAENTIAVHITGAGPLSGVIGDPTNPGLDLVVGAAGVNSDQLVLSASSDNSQIVPDSNLAVVPGPGGQRTLFLDPVGVGYATVAVTVSGPSGASRIAFPYASSAMGRPGGFWHTGASDGSTAIAVDPELVFVGDNENNVIRLYERHRSGPPLREFDFQSDLGLTPEEHGEVNIEASTRAGNRFYFAGAHSNANSGQSRTNRSRVFAVDYSGMGTNSALSYVGRYDYLKLDLIAWDATNGHGKGSNYYGFAASTADTVNPKAPDGFNIEGLTMAPSSTNAAWLGFRAPIVPPTNRTYALVVPVLNFAALAAGGGPPGSAVFGAPIELDLYGRGIRSIEGCSNSFVISAGPPGDVGVYPNDFRLYTWSGDAADQPQQRRADLRGLQPEGISELPAGPWTPDSRFELISDLGTTVLYGDGIQDKHLLVPAFKKFRSDWVALGSVEIPVPIITSVWVTSGQVGLAWRSLKGVTYRLQTAPTLMPAEWADLPGDVAASGPFTTREDVASGTVRFYRVQALPQ